MLALRDPDHQPHTEASVTPLPEREEPCEASRPRGQRLPLSPPEVTCNTRSERLEETRLIFVPLDLRHYSVTCATMNGHSATGYPMGCIVSVLKSIKKRFLW